METLKAQFIIASVGLLAVMVSNRKQITGNPLSILLATALIALGVFAPFVWQYGQHFMYGQPFTPRLNFFWGVGAYWVGLRICNEHLPGFRVSFCRDTKKTVFAFAFYMFLAVAFAWSKFFFVFLILPGAIVTIILPWDLSYTPKYIILR